MSTGKAPLRILVCSVNYAPEMISTGKYTTEMAEWLADRGHEVRVVTAPPHYPQWRVWKGYSSRRYASEELRGVWVQRCPAYVPQRPGGLRRILHLLTFAATTAPVLLAQAFAWRPHVVLVVEPPLLCAPAALAAAALGGAATWLHVQDFEVDMAFSIGLLPPGPLRHAAEAFERFLMRRFTRVSTISGRMVERLVQKGVRSAKTVLFPNWVDVDEIRPLEGPSPLRAELGLPDGAVVALYSGNMGAKQGLPLLVDAASRLRDEPGLLFVLGGEGPARPELEQQAEGLPNVRFLPLQPAERLNDLLNLADIHLLPQRADAEDLVMPSKLTGILASGRPVVATAREGTELADVVGRAGGVRVDPGSAEALAEAVRALARSPADRAERGRAARAWAEQNLSRDAILGRLAAQLGALAR